MGITKSGVRGQETRPRSPDKDLRQKSIVDTNSQSCLGPACLCAAGEHVPSAMSVSPKVPWPSVWTLVRGG